MTEVVCHPVHGKGSQPSPGTTCHPLPEDKIHALQAVNDSSSNRLNDLTTFKKAAFTLAEVLITLAIIGIVAALTIPTLISNYQKKQTVSKLKQTYSILSQALTRAQVDNGDISTWNTGIVFGQDYNAESNRAMVTKFYTQYLQPNLKVAKDYGYVYSTSVKDYDCCYLPWNEETDFLGYLVVLSNGTYLRVVLGTACDEYNDDGVCTAQTNRHLMFYVDINGTAGPNTYGKDLFAMMLNMKTNKFAFYSYDSVSNDRARALNTCASTSDGDYPATCGNLIFLDGWKISDDYPWL